MDDRVWIISRIEIRLMLIINIDCCAFYLFKLQIILKIAAFSSIFYFKYYNRINKFLVIYA